MVCKKIKYPTRRDAGDAVQEIQQKDDERRKKPLRPYYCTYCHGWHLTSMSKEDNEILYKKKTPEELDAIQQQYRERLKQLGLTKSDYGEMGVDGARRYIQEQRENRFDDDEFDSYLK